MGRTGRKREGRIVVLVTEGAEERKYNTSLLSKKAINKVKIRLPYPYPHLVEAEESAFVRRDSLTCWFFKDLF
jgi:ERCC4-related helicase